MSMQIKPLLTIDNLDEESQMAHTDRIGLEQRGC